MKGTARIKSKKSISSVINRLRECVFLEKGYQFVYHPFLLFLLEDRHQFVYRLDLRLLLVKPALDDRLVLVVLLVPGGGVGQRRAIKALSNEKISGDSKSTSNS